MSKGISQEGSKYGKSVRAVEFCTTLNRLGVWQSIWESESLTDESVLRMNLLTREI